jgi:hypothetical protein
MMENLQALVTVAAAGGLLLKALQRQHFTVA